MLNALKPGSVTALRSFVRMVRERENKKSLLEVTDKFVSRAQEAGLVCAELVLGVEFEAGPQSVTNLSFVHVLALDESGLGDVTDTRKAVS